jgi:hypothetical protein
MISRTFITCRKEARLTLSSLASSRSGGNFPPGAIVPLEMSSLIVVMSLAVTLLSG